MGAQASRNEPIGQKLKERVPEIPAELRSSNFRFENLVLEGGGCKTYAYLGGLKVLEELGILKRMRRFAGTSGGAVICMLLAIGYDVRGLYDFFAVDLAKISADAFFGYLSIIPNLLRYFGWHTGKRVHERIKEHIARKCNGNGDITFRELYESRRIELCICVSNVTRLSVEFCHPKTTPDMKIIDAIKMTMALPGFYQPVRYSRDGRDNFYVDGGMLCNYPVAAFDGWYLSMDHKDAFLHKLGGDEEPFGKFNHLTLGMLVYATEDSEVLRTELHTRYDNCNIQRPNTELAREREEECDRKLEMLKQRAKLALAAKSFWLALEKNDFDGDGEITIPEFKRAVRMCPREDLMTLFDKDFSRGEHFEKLNAVAKDRPLTYQDFVHFLDNKGIQFREIMEGSDFCRQLSSLSGFGKAIWDTMSMTVKKLTLKPHDSERTIGVHTDYVQTTDFEITDEDREYIVKKAEYATIAFLELHRQKNPKSRGLLLRTSRVPTI